MRIKFHNSKHQSVDGISAVNWDLSLGFKMMRPFQTALMMLKWVTNLFYVGPCMLRVFKWTIISLHPTVEDLKYIHNQLISCSHQQSIMQHLLCNYPQLVTAPAAYYLSKVVETAFAMQPSILFNYMTRHILYTLENIMFVIILTI